MILSTEDGQLFYRLWLPLLDYVNKKYAINNRLRNMLDAKKLDFKEVEKIADKLWDDVSVVDEYIATDAEDLKEEHKEIIGSWKRRIRGEYLLERHLKKGSIFIFTKDERVFQVKGIMSSWEEMLYNLTTPVLMKATIIPFKDVIISDGLVMPYNIKFGRDISTRLKDIYLTAKKSERIYKNI